MDADGTDSQPPHPDARFPFMLGRFRVVGLLGEGGMGSVYRAEDTGLIHRPVAIKVMKADVARVAANRNRFVHEAQAAAALNHEHIVTVLHADEHDGAPYLVMPLLQGESLRDRIARGGLTVSEACRVGREIADGLAAAHAAGLVHRDVKPGNVWLEAPRGRVKLLDFGLARSVAEAGDTRTGAALGTPAYMAPEQARDAKRADHRADLFSLGCVLYEMLTGTRPFRGSGDYEVLADVLTGTPPACRDRNPDVPAGLSDLVGRLLAKERDDRPWSAAEVADALSAFAEPRSDPTPRPDTPPLPPPARRGWRWRAAAALVALVGVAVFLALRPGPRPAGPEVVNSVGMRLRPVAAGTFTMGAPEDEAESYADERPRHEVEITRPFYLGVCEVTQAEYEAVVGENPSKFKEVAGQDTRRSPVENVSWEDAVRFCERLSDREAAAGRAYRLPTEAEWEYACRAGARRSLPFGVGNGRDLSSELANFDGTKPYGTAGPGPHLGRPAAVGSFPPNAWGLYDTHGNVWEWCADGYDEGFYARSPRQDPLNEEGRDGLHVLRGGSWGGEGRLCRSAQRIKFGPAVRYEFFGFRVACDAPPPGAEGPAANRGDPLAPPRF